MTAAMGGQSPAGPAGELRPDQPPDEPPTPPTPPTQPTRPASEPASGPVLGLDVLDALLGVPPGYPPWRAAEMARRQRVLATWLSAAEARGMPLRPAAAEHLARVRRRMADLYAVADQLAAAHRVTVLKGMRIAAHLPAGLLRESGDVDLVAADQASLWGCVLDLRDRYGAVPQGVSVLQPLAGGRLHLGVSMKWPAEEPYLDKPMGADVTTCAFSGDFRGVPVRAEPLADTDLCSLFAIAEERFQRKFRVKDLLDLVALAGVLDRRFGPDLVERVTEPALALCLAPELRQLVGKAADWAPLPARWADVQAALEPLAVAERAQRGPGRAGMHRLRFGFPLDDRPNGVLAADVHPFDGGELVRTPLGSCLLVDDPVIPAELHERAVAEAERLATQ